MAEQAPADKLDFDEVFETKKSKAEVDALIERLESMMGADMRQLFEGKSIRAPEEWPDAVADAISTFSMTEKTGYWNFRLIDKSRIADMLAKLKGMYRNEDETENPLEQALARIPREELKALAAGLKAMSKADQ